MLIEFQYLWVNDGGIHMGMNMRLSPRPSTILRWRYGQAKVCWGSSEMTNVDVPSKCNIQMYEKLTFRLGLFFHTFLYTFIPALSTPLHLSCSTFLPSQAYRECSGNLYQYMTFRKRVIMQSSAETAAESFQDMISVDWVFCPAQFP